LSEVRREILKNALGVQKRCVTRGAAEKDLSVYKIAIYIVNHIPGWLVLVSFATRRCWMVVINLTGGGWARSQYDN